MELSVDDRLPAPQILSCPHRSGQYRV